MCIDVRDRLRAPSALFRQTAFKECHVGRMPSKLRVRFEKKDRSSKTFWALRENESSFADFPYMRKEEEEAVLKTIPCVVYTRADSSHTTFFRGVVAHFDKMTA
ncbi:unnamed protein product [Toxocara canis]|uniref:YTH domain-containing protein n=1 Tax=Toxocara canis TaxID=6265 RepID=A0A183VHJ3_TOXCA|nr:unnamed protein product [Toxocara canis]